MCRYNCTWHHLNERDKDVRECQGSQMETYGMQPSVHMEEQNSGGRPQMITHRCEKVHAPNMTYKSRHMKNTVPIDVST